jgi:twitching motility protein PilT
MVINELLRVAMERDASDLHLIVASPPMLRIYNKLVPIGEVPLTPKAVKDMFEAITSDRQRETFYRELDLDCAYSVPGLGRFRVNAALQRGSFALTIRCLPSEIPTIDKLRLPEICKSLVLKRRGLIVVTGPPSSGKSTTQAAMIDYLNEQESRKVVTVEDPIEFLHSHKKCLIVQRDIEDDTKSFASAVRHALRQNADVILIGEMRDVNTIKAALAAAETGHLVLGTAHTLGAAETIERLINEFPSPQQEQARMQLTVVLEAVLSQLLLPRADGTGRVALFEIMVATYAIRNLIRDKKFHQIPAMIEMGRQHGMQTFRQAVKDLVSNGIINPEEMLLRTSRWEELETTLSSQSPIGERTYSGFAGAR